MAYVEFDLENPPWAAEPFNGDSDQWGDEQDRSTWFEMAAHYWCSRATSAEGTLGRIAMKLDAHGITAETITDREMDAT